MGYARRPSAKTSSQPGPQDPTPPTPNWRKSAARYASRQATLSFSDSERFATRGRDIGFVFQSFHLLSHRSTLENVMLAELYVARTKRPRGADLERPATTSPRAARKLQAQQALERVGLAHRMDFRPSLLTGGERQRVALARAIVAAPLLGATIGLVAGVHPSLRAARLEPVEALRSGT